MAFTPRQYRSHIDLNLGWPPRSQLEEEHQQSASEFFENHQHHNGLIQGPLLLGLHARDGWRFENHLTSTYHFRVTCPLWTRFMLKPTVGMELCSTHQPIAAMQPYGLRRGA